MRSRLVIMACFLSLGFWGWLMSEGSHSSIKSHVANNSKTLLSADIAISARRHLTEEELKTLNEETDGLGNLSKGYELFAMMSTDAESRLVLVKVIQNDYPFYGELVREGHTPVETLKNYKLWAYSEFKSLFGLERGQTVILGDQKFEVSDFIEEDHTQTFRLASLAPRVFIHLDNIEATKLIQFGSTFTETFYFKAFAGTDVDSLTKSLRSKLKDPAIDVDSYLTLPEENTSPIQRLTDFLGLTSLVALLFSALSLFYLLQIWALEQQKEHALLNSFGLSKHALYFLDIFQSFIVALISTAFSTVLTLLSRPVMEGFLKQWTGQTFQLQLSIWDMLLILLSQFVLLVVLSNPITNAKKSTLAQLLKNSFVLEPARVTRFLPIFLLLLPYSILASRSVKNGSLFFAGLLFVSFSLILIGRGLIRLLSNIRYRSWKFSLAIKSLQRQSTASWAFIFTVGVSSALLNLIPQIQASIEGMMTLEEVQKRPSLFLFDIQKEQWPQVQDLLTDMELTPTAVSPLVRGRITKINGAAFERAESTSAFRTREEENEVRFRNRGVNVTYRPHLQTGEIIVKGKEFPLTYDPDQKHPYVSLEKRYADRIDVGIGDIITFDIQGLEIAAEVKNLRQVTWSRFEPNFFILFQDGLLNDAPQTYLASLPFMVAEKKAQIMKSLSSTISNISIIDVGRLMKSTIENLEKISGSLKLMTYLTLLTGFMTLVFLLTAESLRRSVEVHLLKILGALKEAVFKNRILEVFLISAISLLVGIGASFMNSSILIDQVFQIPVVFNFWPAIAISSSVLLIAWIVSFLTIKRVYGENSFAFLKKEE